MTEDELKNQFSNYERTVWIVNSIHGHFLKYYPKLLDCFDRFPRFPQVNGEFLTPDFAVSFQSGFDIIGEVKRALGSNDVFLNQTYEQILKYDQPLKFRKLPDGPHERTSEAHDIVLFTNIEYAAKEAKKLRELIRSKKSLKRPVVIFSVTFDSQQTKPRWIFSCLTEFSDRFSDAGLPKQNRLSARHQDERESLVIYTNEFAAIQTQHPFCNDAPPSIYTAVLLWAKVFPNLIPPDKRSDWTLEENNQGTVEFSITIDSVILERDRQRLAIRKQQVLDALALLQAGKLVDRKNNDIVIRYRRFRAVFGDERDDEKVIEAAIDHTKQGLIREISRGTSKVATKKSSVVRPKGTKKDERQRLLDL
jgi:hypothetical protein